MRAVEAGSPWRRAWVAAAAAVLAAALVAGPAPAAPASAQEAAQPTPSASPTPTPSPSPSVPPGTPEPTPDAPPPSAEPMPAPTPVPAAPTLPQPPGAGPETPTAEAPVAGDGAAGDIVPGQYLVTVAPSSNPAEVARSARGLGARGEKVFEESIGGFVASMSPQVVARLERDPRVETVEPDRVVKQVQTVQSSPPWGLDRIDERALPLEGRYTYQVDGEGVRVYVIDTGIRSTHADFGGRVAAGFNAFASGSDEDCQGHGTHVAGSVGGATHGVAKGAVLVGVRVLDCNGSGTTSTVIAGIDWMLADRPAGTPAVANLSLGGAASTTMDDAIRRAIAAGITVVVAAGNENADACNRSPARVTEAVTVGATDEADRRASFSNLGSCLDLFAPGVRIPSPWYTSDTAVASLSGTSMATPHVAGVAAQLLDANPSATPTAVADALRAQATTGAVVDPGTGSPNLQLYNAEVAPDTTPPAAVTGLTAAPGLGRATLSWTNPAVPDLGTVVVRMAAGTTPPASPSAGVAVADRVATTATSTGLRVGTDYSFSTFAVDIAGNVSPPASRTLLGTRPTLAASARRVTSGGAVTLSGRLVTSAASAALGGEPVDVLVRRRGTTSWSRLTTLTTSSTGQVSTRHIPATNVDYALRFRGRGTYLGADSAAAPVDVAMRVTSSLSTTSMPLGRTAILSGTVSPSHAGQSVQLQRRVDGVWRSVTRVTLSSTSGYRFSVKPASRGTYDYRVVKPADADHATGVGPTRRLRVS